MTLHPEQLLMAPERRVSLQRALAELDLAAMERNLAADHHERLRAPRATPCRCGRRAWGHGHHCCRCGRDQGPPSARGAAGRCPDMAPSAKPNSVNSVQLIPDGLRAPNSFHARN